MISPRAEFEKAPLTVEREVCDVDFTRTAQLCGRGPEHGTVMVYHSTGTHVTRRVVVSTEMKVK